MKKILFIIMLLLFPIMVNAAACDATSEIKEGYIPEGFDIGYYLYDESTNEFTMDHLEHYNDDAIIKYTKTSNEDYYSLCDTDYYIKSYQFIKLDFNTNETKDFNLIVAIDNLYLLQYPSDKAPALLEKPIKKDTKLEVYTINSGYAGVIYEGKKGWIKYISDSSDVIMCENTKNEYIALTYTVLMCDSYEDNSSCKIVKVNPGTKYKWSCIYNYINEDFNIVPELAIKTNINGQEKWIKNKGDYLLGNSNELNYIVKSSIKLYSTYKLDEVIVELKTNDIFSTIGYQKKIGLVKYNNKYYYINIDDLDSEKVELKDEENIAINNKKQNVNNIFNLDLKIIIIIGLSIFIIVIFIIILVTKKKKSTPVINTQTDSSNINNNNI